MGTCRIGNKLLQIPDVSRVFIFNKINVSAMTCLIDRNACALSCLDTAEARLQQVEDLFNGATTIEECQSVGVATLRNHPLTNPLNGI